MRQSIELDSQKLITQLTLSLENAWALVQYAMRKYWYLLVGATAIGLVLALFNARSAPNEFEVAASVLVPTEEYIMEFDRLHSRSFAEKVADDFRLQRTIHDSKYGWIEMYDESPFEILPMQFPEQLEDHFHSLKILPGRQIRVAIVTGQDSIILQGASGTVLSSNGVKLKINLTDFYAERHLNAQFQFRVLSRAAATNDFTRRLQISHSVQHPNLYQLYFTDLHPQMALDKMTMFMDIYLEAYRQHRYAPLLSKLEALDAKIMVLEQQILSLGQTILPSGFSSLGSDQVTLEKNLQISSLRSRIQRSLTEKLALEAFQKGYRTWESTWEALSGLGQSISKDSVPSVTEIATSIRSRQDSINKLEAELLGLNQSFIATHEVKVRWETAWLSSKQDTFNLSFLLRKDYESTLIERSEIELTARREMHLITVADPPYVSRAIGRSSRMQLFIAFVIGGFMIGLALAVISAGVSPRIQNPAQLRNVLGDAIPWMLLPKDANGRRQVLTNIAMELPAEKRLLSVFGSMEGAEELADLLLTQERAFERSATMINTLQPASEVSPWGIPANISSSWWLSKSAEASLSALAAANETVILAVPDLTDVPEIIGVLVRSHHVYIVLEKGSCKRNSLRNWMASAIKYGLKVTLIWKA